MRGAALDLQFPPSVRLAPQPPVLELRGARADVAAFVGIAARGPLHAPRRITDYPSFTRLFGGVVPQGLLAGAVEAFFLNGGTACWVVRIADPAAAAPAALDLIDRGGQRVRLFARSPGRWAHRLRCVFVRQSARRFTLEILPEDGPAELWSAATFDQRPDDEEDRRITTLLAGSSWLRAVAMTNGSGTSYPEASPLAAPIGEALPAGGADGLATLTEAQFDGELVFPEDMLPFDEPPAQARWSVGEPRPMGIRTLETVDEPAIIAIPDLGWTPPPSPAQRPPARPDCAVLEPAERRPSRAPAEPPEPRPVLDPQARRRLSRRLLDHCRRHGDRVAILDTDPQVLTPREAIEEARGYADSDTDSYGALYWPWLKRPDEADSDLLFPPSGYVAGLWSALTFRRGVHEPPANQPLAAVAGLGWMVDDDTHAWLNRTGVNVFRAVPGRGVRLMGARTLSSDPSLRWLNVRRLLCWLVDTLETECAWLPFEPANEALRATLTRVVRSFLERMWRAGMLEGEVSEDAFSVTCDASTNPPSETDAGRLICAIGINPPWPAEFVRVRLVRTDAGFNIETGTESPNV